MEFFAFGEPNVPTALPAGPFTAQVAVSDPLNIFGDFETGYELVL